MPTLPPLNALRAFEAVARLGSYAQAADALNVTPAAIGQHIRQLEASLGVALFARDGRRLALTPRGQASRDRLTRAFAMMDDAAAIMRAPDDGGVVTIAAPSSFTGGWLLQNLARYNTGNAPQLTLRTLAPTTPITDGVQAAFEDGADSVVVLAPGQTPSAGRSSTAPPNALSRFTVTPLMDETLTPMATPPWRDRIGLRAENLANVPLIGETTPGMDWATWSAGRRLADDPRIALRCDDPMAVIAATRAGHGVGLVRKSVVNSLSAGGEGWAPNGTQTIGPVLHDGDHPTGWRYVALTLPDRQTPPTVAAFLAWLTSATAVWADADDVL